MAGDPELRHVAAGEGRKLLLLGDVRTMKLTGEESGDELTVVEQVVAPGAGSALHRHPYQELFYVLEGELEFTGLQNGSRTTFDATTGCAVHAGPGVAHGYRNNRSEPARFLAVMQPAGAEGFFAEAGVWLAEDGSAPAATAVPSPAAVREAAARHGIEFLEGA
jgi:quercetin dioxygenase-like cupin family protein